MKVSKFLLVLGLAVCLGVAGCNYSAPPISPNQSPTATVDPLFFNPKGELPTFTPTPLYKTLLLAAMPCAEGDAYCQFGEMSIANLYRIPNLQFDLRLQPMMKGGRIINWMTLSPDGRRILFKDSREEVQYSPYVSHLYVYELNTLKIEDVTKDWPEESIAFAPTWFPDGSQFLYGAVPVNSWGTAIGPTSLYRVRLGGGGRNKVWELPIGDSILSMAISPDGKHLALTAVEYRDGKQEMWVYFGNSDGSKLDRIKPLSKLTFNARVLWLANSHFVIFDRIDEIYSGVYIYEIGSSGEVGQLMEYKLAGNFLGWHTLSPAEFEVAICENSSYISIWNLSMTRPPDRMQYFPNSSCSGIVQGWSPDGQQIALARGSKPDPIARYGLYILDRATGAETQILSQYKIVDFVWVSPDVIIPPQP